MIVAVVVLVAGNVAIGAERGGVEVVAVAIEMILGVIFVPGNMIFGAELFGAFPSKGFELE